MKVYFEGGFWGHSEREKPCRRLKAQQSFAWKGYTWHLLGVYVCGRGLVLDFAKEVPVERIRAFMEKWRDRIEEGEVDLAESSQIDFENPLETAMDVKAWVNGRQILSMGGCGCSHNPLAEGVQAVDQPAEELLLAYEDYGLDREQGWYFYRMNLRWDYQRIPAKIALKLELLPDTYYFPCPETFETVLGESGKTVSFTHPLQKRGYRLIVEKVRQECVEEKSMEPLGDFIFPRNFQMLEYRIEDTKDEEMFIIRDRDRGDNPVPRSSWERHGFSGKRAFAVSMAAGQSGATSIFLAGPVHGERETEAQSTVSRLCFEPVERTCWQIQARVSRGEHKNLELFFERPGKRK